jgi:hypothetical protein
VKNKNGKSRISNLLGDNTTKQIQNTQMIDARFGSINGKENWIPECDHQSTSYLKKIRSIYKLRSQ